MANIQVALDGPAGSGKSTISKIIAERLGFTHIDTGAMFRAITLYALDHDIELENENEYGFLDKIKITYEDDVIRLNGKDVSKEIRTDRVTKNVSAVSRLKVVRDMMVTFERNAAAQGKILMDGRDIGSVILPNADVKIFLTASKEERAKRRQLELIEKGVEVTYEEVLQDIIERDRKDSTRAIAPLKQAEDAILLDTTNLNIEEVCDEIIKIVLDKVGKKMSDVKEILSMEDVNIDDFGNKPRKGEILTGTVVTVTPDEVFLDLHQFTEGRIHLDHYTLDKSITTFEGLVHEGDEMTVEITKVDDNEKSGAIFCSRLKLIKDEKFKELEKFVEEKTNIRVKIEKENPNKGFFVSYQGFRFFMPKSQAPRDSKVGDEVEVRILNLDLERKSALVSARVIADELRDENRNNELESIHEGDVLTGKVVKILPFACFVQFNYVQGMLRLPEICHNYIEKIEDVLAVGDEVTVKVLSVKNGKITLSRKALLKTPIEEYALSHKKGEKVTGKVISKLPYGILLEVAPNVRGLLHQSEYSWNPDDNFNDYVKIGDEVEVAINDINAEKERVSLSRKALIDNPWARVNAEVGEVVDCKIVELDQNGMTVEALGVNGFITTPAALTEGQNGKLDDYYAVGDTVKAMITEIRPREWKLRLSIRKIAEAEAREEYEKYMDNQEDEGNVTLGDMFKDVLEK